jgi:hypothetical protein
MPQGTKTCHGEQRHGVGNKDIGRGIQNFLWGTTIHAEECDRLLIFSPLCGMAAIVLESWVNFSLHFCFFVGGMAFSAMSSESDSEAFVEGLFFIVVEPFILAGALCTGVLYGSDHKFSSCVRGTSERNLSYCVTCHNKVIDGCLNK